MNNLGLLLRKYSVPAIFTIVGFAVLIYGFSNGQSGTFLFASAMMLAAGVLSGLFSMGKLTPPVVVGTGIGFGIIALILIYLSYDSVSTTRQYERDRRRIQHPAGASRSRPANNAGPARAVPAASGCSRGGSRRLARPPCPRATQCR